jgi:hypothetical protein
MPWCTIVVSAEVMLETPYSEGPSVDPLICNTERVLLTVVEFTEI